MELIPSKTTAWDMTCISVCMRKEIATSVKNIGQTGAYENAGSKVHEKLIYALVAKLGGREY